MMKEIRKLGVILLAVVLLTACSSSKGNGSATDNGKDVDIQEVVDAVKKAYGDNYYPEIKMKEAFFEDIYGVKAANVDKFFGEMPILSILDDTFIAVKAKPGKGKDVKASLEEYKAAMLENGLIYPMNMAKVQSTEIIQHGDYVFYVMLGAMDESDSSLEADVLKFAQEQTKIGVDVINSFFE